MTTPNNIQNTKDQMIKDFILNDFIKYMPIDYPNLKMLKERVKEYQNEHIYYYYLLGNTHSSF